MEHTEYTYLGIDLGTSAMKMVLIDGKKNILAQVTEEYQTVQPEHGLNEIDPEIWYECMESAMERILKLCDRSLIRSIGVTGQMHTLVVLNGEGKQVRPAIMWNDVRTKDMVPMLKEKIREFPEGEYLSRTISTGSPAANLFWLKEKEPEHFSQMKKFLIGPDYLVYRLTGHCGTDYCEASTSCLYQIKARKWSPEMRELIGLKEETYPQIRGSALPAGKILPDIAERFLLSGEIQVLTGTGDNPATAVSTGCLGQGYPVISLGTSGVLMMPVSEMSDHAKGKIILFSFDDENYSYLVQGAVQSNGSTYEWWVRGIMGEDDFSKMDSLIDAGKSRNSEVIFYPHLMGEKTLYADPGLRGAFIGLSTETDRSDMLYAVLEGLCFSFRELAEKMELPLRRFGSVKVVGGGSKSRVWMQIFANVLNISIEQMDGMIGPAFGIALLAAYRSGCFVSPEQITEGTVKLKNRFEPEPEAVADCEKRYQKYLRIQKGLKYIMDGSE